MRVAIALLSVFFAMAMAACSASPDEYDWMMPEHLLPIPKEKFFVGDVDVFGPLSVEDVERRSMEKMRTAPKAPQVPFGYQHEKWLVFKNKLEPGDDLYEFWVNNRESTVAGDFAASGIVIVRDEMVVEVLPTTIY